MVKVAISPEVLADSWAGYRQRCHSVSEFRAATENERAELRNVLEASGVFESLALPEAFPDGETLGVLCVHAKRHERTMRAGFVEGLLFALYMAEHGVIE